MGEFDAVRRHVPRIGAALDRLRRARNTTTSRDARPTSSSTVSARHLGDARAALVPRRRLRRRGHRRARSPIASARLHGVDVAAEAVARAAEQNPTVAIGRTTATRLPYDDRFVDVAFAICVTHHIPCDERAALLAELHRVVRVGGLVAIFEHNPFNPLTRSQSAGATSTSVSNCSAGRRSSGCCANAGLVPIESRYIIFSTSERPRRRLREGAPPRAARRPALRRRAPRVLIRRESPRARLRLRRVEDRRAQQVDAR